MSETAELLTLESAMFSSTYEHTLDAKNRLFIPVKIREAVGDAFYLFAPPREKCLYIYSPERWEEVARAVLSKNDRNYELWDTDTRNKELERLQESADLYADIRF